MITGVKPDGNNTSDALGICYLRQSLIVSVSKYECSLLLRGVQCGYTLLTHIVHIKMCMNAYTHMILIIMQK